MHRLAPGGAAAKPHTNTNARASTNTNTNANANTHGGNGGVGVARMTTTRIQTAGEAVRPLAWNRGHTAEGVVAATVAIAVGVGDEVVMVVVVVMVVPTSQVWRRSRK